MPSLFEPLALRSLSARNRIFIPPMCQYRCAPDGKPTSWHMAHYGARAIGGAGLIIVEATAIVPEGRITPADCGLWNAEQIAAFAPITAFIKDQGAIAAVQIAHAGRKANAKPPQEGEGALPESDPRAWVPVAPSAIPFSPAMTTPHELTQAEIEALIEAFAASAKRALQAGFEAIEIHSAHGYLLHEFLSPLTNKREDAFGGSLEGRMRFPLAVAKAVREAVPDHLPVMVRLSATDWVEGGWDLEQSIAYATALKALGIDLIDVSTGGLMPDAAIPVAPGFQVPFATSIRERAGLPTSAVGLITEAQQANALLREDKADAVCIGRAALRDPHWPLRAQQELGLKVTWPFPYLRAGKF